MSRSQQHMKDVHGYSSNYEKAEWLETEDGSGEEPYQAQAVHFDTGTILERGAALTGASGEYTQCLISFWAKVYSSNFFFGSRELGFFQGATQYSQGEAFALFVGDEIFDGDALSGTFTEPGEPRWVHVVAAYDHENEAGSLVAVDGVLSTAKEFLNAGPPILTGETDFYVGSNISDIADFYVAIGQFLDLSNPANIAKFIADGKPVDLGADGSLPTGTAPTIFFSGNASSFTTNKGTGGAFTLTGELTDADASEPVQLPEPWWDETSLVDIDFVNDRAWTAADGEVAISTLLTLNDATLGVGGLTMPASLEPPSANAPLLAVLNANLAAGFTLLWDGTVDDSFWIALLGLYPESDPGMAGTAVEVNDSGVDHRPRVDDWNEAGAKSTGDGYVASSRNRVAITFYRNVGGGVYRTAVSLNGSTILIGGEGSQSGQDFSYGMDTHLVEILYASICGSSTAAGTGGADGTFTKFAVYSAVHEDNVPALSELV